jgi:hypothetical protein
MKVKKEEIYKVCPACGMKKNLKGYYRMRNYPDGYSPRCKRCILDRVIIPRNSQFKEQPKPEHLKTHEEILDMRGVTPNDIRESYLLLTSIGYNVCENIHLQFCEKYGLKPKKKRYSKPRSTNPQSLGIC